MACFITPAAAAVLSTGVKHKIPKKYHVEWLIAMLWGGVAMLAVEHYAHGEIVLYPPFLTAMQDPAEIPVMLWEMATVGGAMTVAVFTAWTAMVIIAQSVPKMRRAKAVSAAA